MSIRTSAQRAEPSSPSSAESTLDQVPTARLQEALRALDTTARMLRAQLGGRFAIDDLKELAHEALVDLLGRFDPARGVPFGGYARLRLRGAILDGLRKQSGLPRGVTSRLHSMRAGDLFIETHHPVRRASSRRSAARDADAEIASLLRGVATACALGWACVRDEEDGESLDVPSTRTLDDPETNAERAQSRRAIERALKGLDDKEAWIVRRHFLEGADVQDAAAELGLSKSWGSRLLARGVARLGERLKEMRFDWGP
jgi:RNA polymerase sigma factor for flagellar operon FliA